ncbi:hypothetical protein [Profundibacter sp.]|uniref:hypothetical protein n=1 Tax=Profundibacter sp. TaxID=3101071 RepID=UPI003D137F8D
MIDISEQLDAINAAFDSVRISAFADLSVQLVLADSSKSDIGQELLDEMCIQAANAFECPTISSDNSLGTSVNSRFRLLRGGVDGFSPVPPDCFGS